MSSADLMSALLPVAGILALAVGAGRLLVFALVPGGARLWTLERWGWSIVAAPLVLGGHLVVAFFLGFRPGGTSFVGWVLCLAVLSWRGRLPHEPSSPSARPGFSPAAVLFVALTVAGIAIYLVRGLSEPMWSNDFLAVWGLKGKTIFADAGIPQRLFRWPEFEFSNPAYPIGLPLVYAGIAFLLGRWDDHAMALLFPILQLGTILVLAGWLRRRGAQDSVAFIATAFVANFGILYSAWLTGMAEIPAAFTFLLVGTALWDVLDDTDPGAVRRLAVGSLLAAATKNEGVFLVATAFALLAFQAIRRGERRLWVGAAAVLIPVLGSVLAHRILLGSHPIRGLDLQLLWRPGLGARAVETIRVEWAELVRPIWPGIAAVLLLAGLGPRRAEPNPILVLVAASLATYLVLPVLCPFGPLWLIHWTVGRITSALVPLLVAGIGMTWRGPPPATRWGPAPPKTNRSMLRMRPWSPLASRRRPPDDRSPSSRS